MNKVFFKSLAVGRYSRCPLTGHTVTLPSLLSSLSLPLRVLSDATRLQPYLMSRRSSQQARQTNLIFEKQLSIFNTKIDRFGQRLLLSWRRGCFLYQGSTVQIKSSETFFKLTYLLWSVIRTKIKKKRPRMAHGLVVVVTVVWWSAYRPSSLTSRVPSLIKSKIKILGTKRV